MKRLAAVLLVVGALFASVPAAGAASPEWDGKPWTVSHPEPCRRYEPMTLRWVRTHPHNPCARVAMRRLGSEERAR